MTLFGRDISPNLVKMSYFKVDTSTVRYLSSLLLQKILMNYEVKVLHVKFEMDKIHFLTKNVLLDAICMTLLLADLDNSNRNDLFLQLGQKLFLGHRNETNNVS